MDIIDRIRAQRPNAKHVTATFDEDTETWRIDLDGVVYIMQIGSDDDAFVFTSETGDVIEFDFE